MDPPWENKSAKRAAKYPTVPSRRFLSIPVPQLLNKEVQSLVAQFVVLAFRFSSTDLALGM